MPYQRLRFVRTRMQRSLLIPGKRPTSQKPLLKPRAIEEPVQGEIAGVRSRRFLRRLLGKFAKTKMCGISIPCLLGNRSLIQARYELMDALLNGTVHPDH